MIGASLDDICNTIAMRRVLSFDYDGHHRVVQPAAAGTHRTTGNNMLRGYQIGGSGNTRAVPFWDLYLVDYMTNFSVLDEVFDDDPPMYRRGDKHINVRREL